MNFDYEAAIAPYVESEFQIFIRSLLPENAVVRGIRLPVLHKIARLILVGDYLEFLETTIRADYEYRLLYAFVLADAPIPEAERRNRIRAFVPMLDNWGVCDALCSALKSFLPFGDAEWAFVAEVMRSRHPYTIRFGVVMYLMYDAEKSYFSEAMELFSTIDSHDDTVQKAIGWALAETAIKRFPDVLNLLSSGKLSNEIVFWTVRKACESRRIAFDDKAKLRALRVVIRARKIED